MFQRRTNTLSLLLLLLFLLPATFSGAQQKSLRGGVKKAEGFYALGDSLYSAGSYTVAAKYYDMAGGIFEKKGRWLEAARSYLLGAESYFENREIDTSILLLEKSLYINELNNLKKPSDGDLCYLEALLLMSKIKSNLEDFNKSLDYLKVGIRFAEKISNEDINNKALIIKSEILRYGGLIYSKMGDYNNAILLFNQAIDILRKLHGDNSHIVAQVYSYAASIYLFKEDYENAEIYLSKSYNIFLLIYGRSSVNYASSLLNYSSLYKGLGDSEKAEEYLLLAKEIYLNEYGEKDIRIANIYNNLANISIDEGSYEKALRYYQKAREIYMKEFNPKLSLVAFIDNNIGLLYYQKKDYLSSIPHFVNAIITRKKIYGTKHFRLAQSYHYLGCTYLEMSDFRKSLDLFQKALIALCNDFNDTSIIANPEIKSEYKVKDLFNILSEKFYALYKYSFTQQDCPIYLEAALNTYELSYSLLDIIRTEYTYQDSKIIFTENNKKKLLKAFFLFDELNDSSQNFYKDNYFLLGEKLKSFVLYSSIFENEISVNSGIPDSIKEIENTQKNEIKYLKTKIQQKKILDNETDSNIIAELDAMILKSTQSYDSLLNYLKISYPNYYELKYQANIPSVTDIMKQLSEHEVIIDYLISDTLLYFLLFTSDDYYVIKNPVGRGLEEEVVSYYRQIKKAGNDKQIAESGQELYKKLISPIESIIRDKQRLIIIPDEYLGYLPFETLIQSDEIKRNYSGLEIPDYLLNDHEIVYNYSVSLWWKSRTKKDSVLFAKEFVGFAPVFDNYINFDTNKSGILDSLKYSVIERSFLGDDSKIEKLPYSKEEVEEIDQLFVNDNQKTKVFIGEDATKSNFVNNITDSRYVHIATHGFANDKFPELSGLVFNPAIDSSILNIDKDRRIDFYDKSVLFSGDMYNLDINTDLLVLSACETGLGKLSKGEGMLAMTRGLIYSGADNILFSLWKVNDKYTKELMLSFYRKILSGQSYSNALRLAKIEMYNSDITSIPKFWSSFILLGE